MYLDFVKNIASPHPYVPQRILFITSLLTVQQLMSLLHSTDDVACPSVFSPVIVENSV